VRVKGGVVHGDELRHLVREQARTKEAQEQTDRDFGARQRPEALWANAREAVRTMGRILEAAAKTRCTNAFVYRETGSNHELGISFRLLKTWPWEKGVSDIVFEMPPFAKYVFDNCPQGVEVKWHIQKELGGRGGMPDGCYDSGSPATIELEVSWWLGGS
jgi:hypothetical protein